MWIFGWKGPSGFSARSTAEEVTHGIDASGITAIVTGASSGIGIETTRVLALRGAHVIMAMRNMGAGREVKEAIMKELPSAQIDTMELDLSSMASVRKFASDYVSSGLPLNLLVNNAGIFGTPFMLSQEGIELHIATNHSGHFLLTNLLLETMKRTSSRSNKEGRIVNLTSEAHRLVYHDGIRFDKINDESGYNFVLAYGQSKLANILHAKGLARLLKVIYFLLIALEEISHDFISSRDEREQQLHAMWLYTRGLQGSAASILRTVISGSRVILRGMLIWQRSCGISA
ncbi:short-chain dehydrogenase TIC 32, chloroplastic-like isoform X1 [Punica granatum]|uniref:Short-chain dehydrogenase TIC 32, chloroplastic-like isoform X1 n=1 Tax=Punica granatum TaxID=22663 RepID=A0A6P8CCU7_PUNGR|nr:short-chain dehydrogenase TIC 32, chloroplastic-like isoform X1 [Punica granatum]